MPRVSAAFFAIGGLLLLSGMLLGEYMGAHENFALAPLHAHINLLGWVTLALYGTFYTLTKDTYSPRLGVDEFRAVERRHPCDDTHIGLAAHRAGWSEDLWTARRCRRRRRAAGVAGVPDLGVPRTGAQPGLI